MMRTVGYFTTRLVSFLFSFFFSFSEATEKEKGLEDMDHRRDQPEHATSIYITLSISVDGYKLLTSTTCVNCPCGNL